MELREYTCEDKRWMEMEQNMSNSRVWHWQCYTFWFYYQC